MILSSQISVKMFKVFLLRNNGRTKGGLWIAMMVRRRVFSTDRDDKYPLLVVRHDADPSLPLQLPEPPDRPLPDPQAPEIQLDALGNRLVLPKTCPL